MKKTLPKLWITVPFLLLLFTVSVGTLRQSLSDIVQTIKQDGFNDTAVETILKDSLYGKDNFREVSGMARKLLGRRLTSDGQFYLADDGLIHLSSAGEASHSILLESTCYLGDQLAEKELPFLIFQTAERAAYGDSYSQFVDGGSLNYIEPLKEMAIKEKISYFDCAQMFAEEGVSSKDIFFKTDFHYTTQAELLILEYVIEALESKCGLSFPAKTVALNWDNYEIEEYDFRGNLGSNEGESFTGKDCFQYFLPSFDTSLLLENPSQGISKSGTFENVCMNGYRNMQNDDPRVYRITDYMQWPSPYYTVTNHLVENNHVLVIGDSMTMRMAAYLTLLCHKVTMLDPRYFDGYNYLKNVDFEQVDAVIFLPSDHLLNGINAFDAEIQSFQVELKGNGLIDLSVDVRNTGSVCWRFEDKVRMVTFLNDQDTGVRAELPVDQVVNPEDTYTFIFRDLDSRILSQNATVQMLKEGVLYFGERGALTSADFTGETIDALLQKLPEKAAQTADYWIGRGGLCLDTCNGEIVSDADIVVRSDAQEVELEGWAADFEAGKPLSALYVQVGENYIPCIYGIERTSVSDNFGNIDLKDTGFTAHFPASYLLENPSGTIRFIQVSASGNERYEPVIYQIVLLSEPLSDHQSEPNSY